MRTTCVQLGQLDYADIGITSFRLPNDVSLNLYVADDGGRTVGAAIISVAAWDTLSPEEDHGDERAAFDTVYDELLSSIVTVAGQPDLQGMDRSRFPFRWSLWRGRNGVMVAQQSCWDYMPDINIWIRPYGLGPINPYEPFADWLMEWS